MSANWSDLRIRVLSAAVMLVIGVTLIWAGGVWFAILVALCAGLMVWELARMVGGTQSASIALGALGAVATPSFLLLTGAGGSGWVFKALPFIMVSPAIAGAMLLSAHRQRFAIYSVAIIISCAAFLMFRQIGLQTVVMLVAIVAVTDMAGYFAGRLFGGPKFWPGVSPGKTWSGTAAGWIAAGLVMLLAGGGAGGAALGVLLAFASQMGDAAESALKRRMGVKDSSTLIPGHGGLLDRFDGLAGATLAMLVLLMFGLHIQDG